MESLKLNLEQEIKELFNTLKSKKNIELDKLNIESYSKGIIICINEFINKYINNINSSKRKKIISIYY